MKSELTHRDLFVRITGHNGKSHVRCHRVWDAERFLTSMKKQGSEAKKPEDRFTVAPATIEEYRSGRGAS